MDMHVTQIDTKLTLVSLLR